MQHLEGDDVVLLEDEGLSILLDAKEKIETDSSSSAERETSTEGKRKEPPCGCYGNFNRKIRKKLRK